MREINFRQAIGEAMDEEMERDERVYILGEDVGVMGGLMGEIGGLYEKYPPGTGHATLRGSHPGSRYRLGHNRNEAHPAEEVL